MFTLSFFRERSGIFIRSYVDKPLQVDLTTKHRTRPSCARVKMDVDLLGDPPSKKKNQCWYEEKINRDA